MDRVFGNNIENTRVFLRSTSQGRKTRRGIVKEVLDLWKRGISLCNSRHVVGHTVIVVPSFPAQGRGSEGFPVFWSTKAPSEYVALGRTSIIIRRGVNRK